MNITCKLRNSFITISQANKFTTISLWPLWTIRYFPCKYNRLYNQFSSQSKLFRTSYYTLQTNLRISVKKSYYNKRIYSSTSSQINSKAPSNVKISKKEFSRLLSLAKPEKWTLTGAICLLLVSSTVTMAVPFALGKVIDVIYTADPNQMRQNLNNLCSILLGVFVVGGICNFGRVYLMTVSGHRITRALREKVFNSILKQEVAFFDKNKTGELINRLSTDTSLVSQCVTMNISDGLRSSIMVCAGVSMMFYMSPELALVGLSIVPPVAFLAIVYGRFVRNITKSVQDALAEATQVAEERIGNIRTVKTFSQEMKEIETYRERMQHILDLATKESLARGIFYGMFFLDRPLWKCDNIISIILWRSHGE
uniref:ABC transmembrane type-1 domain-containing protein n=1 Tax=Clastoptera arizonana TaxID=38151 RepID=A0A1B6CL44_9HEMI